MNDAPHEKITPASLGMRHGGRSLLVNIDLHNVTAKRVSRAASRVVLAIAGPQANPHVGLGGQAGARGHMLRFLVNTDEEPNVIIQRVQGALTRVMIRCTVKVGVTTEVDALEVWATAPGRRALGAATATSSADGEHDADAAD